MTRKGTPKKRNSKLHNIFLIEQAKKLNKQWLDNGGTGNRKYFGHFNKNSMSAILLAILFLVILGDVILIHNYLYR